MNKKKRHKLTPEEHKYILENARLLPKLVRLRKDGTQMARAVVEFQGQHYHDIDGKKSEKPLNHIKRITEPLFVNHEVEMISQFWDGGRPAVDRYIKKCHEIAADGGKDLDENGMPSEPGKEGANA